MLMTIAAMRKSKAFPIMKGCANERRHDDILYFCYSIFLIMIHATPQVTSPFIILKTFIVLQLQSLTSKHTHTLYSFRMWSTSGTCNPGNLTAATIISCGKREKKCLSLQYFYVVRFYQSGFIFKKVWSAG